MEGPHKLTIKLPNGAEFSAEGTEDSIKEMFKKFEQLWNQPAPARPAPMMPTEAVVAPVAAAVAEAGAESQLMDRLFVTDDYAGVSLLAKPTGDNANGDALIALLYGFAKLLNENSPTAIKLMRAAEKSGVKVDRLDRVLNNESQWITTSGARKGKRYGLNNPGLLHAEEILKSILG